METKLLDFNLDKSCYMVLGPKEKQKEIRTYFEASPLTLSGQSMKEVSDEKYLGDYISSEGLAKSTFVTIKKRYDKVKTALKEIRAVIEDCRANLTGGIITGLEIWEVAVIPFLLNNSETWTELEKDALEMLENLQVEFLRNLLDTPRTCPIPSLLWETGTSTMENRILKRKLLLYYHLIHLPQDSLAWEIAQIQDELHLPGLIQECKENIDHLKLPEAKKCSKFQWKNAVKKKMMEINKSDLIGQVKNKEYKKIDAHKMENEEFGRKPYLSNLDIHSARMKFGIQTKMVRSVKLNYKNDPANKKKMWKCDDCQSIDSQDHILWCPAYSLFRHEKNLEDDKDLTRYFLQVLRFRDK